jgi:hypothetical protein
MSTFTGTGSSDTPVPRGPHRLLLGLPQHLQGWQLPPGWRWGEHGVVTGPRHAQEVIDVLRSIARAAQCTGPGARELAVR